MFFPCTHHRRHVRIASCTSGWYLKHTNETGRFFSCIPLFWCYLFLSGSALAPQKPFGIFWSRCHYLNFSEVGTSFGVSLRQLVLLFFFFCFCCSICFIGGDCWFFFVRNWPKKTFRELMWFEEIGGWSRNSGVQPPITEECLPYYGLNHFLGRGDIHI